MNCLLEEFFNWIYLCFKELRLNPSKKILSWPQFFKLNCQYADKRVFIDLEYLLSHSATCYIIPKMNQSVFNSLQLEFSILLSHMMFTRAIDFNMQLFGQSKHFLTYILFCIAFSAGEEMLPWQHVSCCHLFIASIVYLETFIISKPTYSEVQWQYKWLQHPGASWNYV